MDLQLSEVVCCIAQTTCELRRLVCALKPDGSAGMGRSDARCDEQTVDDSMRDFPGVSGISVRTTRT